VGEEGRERVRERERERESVCEREKRRVGEEREMGWGRGRGCTTPGTERGERAQTPTKPERGRAVLAVASA
jgi:hypothetical protein